MSEFGPQRREPLRVLVQDRGKQCGLSDLERGGDVRCPTRAARGDHGNRDGCYDGGSDLEVVALAGAVGVDRGEQDLARAPLLGLLGPVDGAAGGLGGTGASLDEAALGVDRDDDRLRAEPGGKVGEERRACERRRVDRDLVGARGEERVGVGNRADAAADRERDRELLGDAPDDTDEGVALVQGRLHVEEDELVGAAVGVRRAELDRIANVAEVLKLDALDDAAARDVEAGDQARESDRSLTSRSTPSR